VSASGLLYLLPVLLLVAAVLLRRGRVPGERLLVRAVERARRALRRPRKTGPRPRPPIRRTPSGGILLACSLAGRAPPAGR
jgi:hypothetical protein